MSSPLTNLLPPFSWHLRLLLFLSVSWGTTGFARAQTPVWQTVLSTSQASGSSSEVHATAADSQGNIYVVGGIIGTVQFGNTTLVSEGSQDLFVAKWNNASNSFVWAQRAGGPGIDYVNSVVVQGSTIYISGYVNSANATFGAFSLANDDPGSDVFVAKLTDAGTSGSFAWVQQAHGNFNPSTSLTAQGANIYLVGAFVATATFGPYSLNSAVVNYYDQFVAKLIDRGTDASFIWVEQASGQLNMGGPQGFVEAYTVAVNGSALYVGGNFSGKVHFGSSEVSALGDYDGFVAKLLDTGTQGRFVWVQALGGTGQDQVKAITVNGSAIYAVGTFRATATIGTTSLANNDPTGRTQDGYVAKLVDEETTARFIWSQRIGGTDDDEAVTVAVNQSTVYVAGSFRSTTAEVGSSSLSNAGSYDGFLTRITDAGTTATFDWAQRFGGTGFDLAMALSITGTTVVVSGYASAPAQFGDITLAATGGTGVAFLASLTENSRPLPVELASFTVTKKQATAELRWTTSLELRNKHFEIEVSPNGQQFRRIGRTDGQGTSTIGYTYIFTDSNLQKYGSPIVYYRLRQTDETGEATYSLVRTIASASGSMLVQAYPLPFSSTLHVQIVAPAAGLATLQLQDMLGRFVQQTSVTLSAGSSEVTFLPAGNLPVGTYFLTIQSGSWRQKIKLVHE